MSEEFQNEEIPSKNDIQEQKQRAEDIKERIIEYLEKAEIINENSRSEDDDRYRPLDAVPYGEEFRDLEDYPDELDEVISKLNIIAEKNGLTSEYIIETYNECDNAIDSAESKLDTCKPLPSERKREIDEEE